MEILTILKDTPIPTIFVLGGLTFLVLSIVNQVGGKIKVARKRQNISIVIGAVLLLLGLALYLIPTIKLNSQVGDIPSITGVTMRESIQDDELVILQEINFVDEDGNTNYIEWELINLSDPSQRQYINIVNSTVNAPRDEQRNGSYATGTWHCYGHTYVATLEVSVFDENGNKSEPYQYDVICK